MPKRISAYALASARPEFNCEDPSFKAQEGCFSVGAGRPSAEGPWRPNSFGTHADRRPKALRRLKSASSGAARRASAPPTRRVFPVGAGRPSAEGLRRPNSFGTHADRRPKALCRLKSASQGAARQASASADAKGFPGRRMPTVGRRPPEAEFIRHACRPSAEGLRRPNSFGMPTAGRRLCVD